MKKPKKIKQSGRGESMEIPVVVDDVKADETFAMARCTYFSIESQSTVAEPWTIGLKGPDLPVLLMGMSGAIIGAHPKHFEFRNADELDDLLNRIEDDTCFVVETANIWLPNQMAVRHGGLVQDLVRGDVLRVGIELFQAGQRFGSEAMPVQQFMKQAGGIEGQIRLSHSESEVMAEWTSRQMSDAKKMYGRFRDKGQVLSWRDDAGEIHPG